MGTVVLACGCWFSYSMFGDRELLNFGLCQKHCNHPKVQVTKVKELQNCIMSLQEAYDEVA